MFKRIRVAYSQIPEAGRALTAAILLARTLSAQLRAVTILGALPAYTHGTGGTSDRPLQLKTTERDGQ
jgi:hypothetical protein